PTTSTSTLSLHDALPIYYNFPQSAIRHPQSLVRLPDLIIVDGGKGQLSAACRELQRLGLHDLPIIGLAKEREEIYRPGRALPLRSEEHTSELQSRRDLVC